jgi:hypothetical protein
MIAIDLSRNDSMTAIETYDRRKKAGKKNWGDRF